MADAPEPRLRPATPADRSELQDLICVSLNYWYRAAGKPAVVTGGPAACGVFWEVYEALDPGCCVVAEDPPTGRLMGCCFYHPRATHVSVGIMAAHPNYFGRGVARRLLRFVTDLADRGGLPTRLVSSAMNLDSYSLYTRAGFYPRALYHDMVVPVDKVRAELGGVDARRVRPATTADVSAIADLEWRVSGVRREADWRHLIDNAAGIWHVAVHASVGGGGVGIDGVLASVDHAGSHMLGPGVMADDAVAAALVGAELTRLAGRAGADRTPVFLIPADRPGLVRTVYDWGGQNLELHVVQVRGEARPFAGISMPTFMPETG
jgi:GNAT superfamily N-acetyltransferase